MRKLVFSIATILIFAFYIVLIKQNSDAAGNKIAVAPPVPIPPANQVPAQSSPAPSGKSSSRYKRNQGAYVDGTYTGAPADAFFGTVQVAAVISNGRLSNIRILQYPSDTGHSMYVSQVALPMLKQEAIQAQSANVDIISGATQTSGAFQESLQSALSQAKN